MAARRRNPKQSGNVLLQDLDMLKRTARHQHGFTLTELLIVVIILAILAAIVVPQFASSSDAAAITSDDSLS